MVERGDDEWSDKNVRDSVIGTRVIARTSPRIFR